MAQRVKDPGLFLQQLRSLQRFRFDPQPGTVSKLSGTAAAVVEGTAAPQILSLVWEISYAVSVAIKKKKVYRIVCNLWLYFGKFYSLKIYNPPLINLLLINYEIYSNIHL